MGMFLIIVVSLAFLVAIFASGYEDKPGTFKE